MIDSLEVSHYKSLTDVRLQLGPINIIVGPNGSGKSNFIDAIKFLHDCVNEDIDTALTKRHGIDSIRQWSRTRPYHVTISVRFRNGFGVGSYKLVLSSSKGSYRIIEETGEWRGSTSKKAIADEAIIDSQHFTFYRKEDGSSQLVSNIEPDVFPSTLKIDGAELMLNSIRFRGSPQMFVLLRSLIHELSSFSTYSIYPNTLRLPQIVSRERTLNEDGSNLATVLRNINSNARNKKSKDDMMSAFKTIMPMATDLVVRSAGGYYVPVIRVEEPGGEAHDFNLSQISDGTLRLLGLITAFYQPLSPGKIAVEEPEQMIHPGALPIIVEAARDYVDRNKEQNGRSRHQVFITSHSPSLLDNFDASEIIWARFLDGETRCGKVSKRQVDLIKEALFSPGEILLAEGFF